MDGLIEVIGFAAVIIFGILKSLSGNKTEQDQQRKPDRPNQVPKPTPTPSGGRSKPKQPVYESNPSKVYAEEQQRKQMEQLASRMNTQVNVSVGDISQQDLSLGTAIQDEIKNHSLDATNENMEQFKKDVKTGLNSKGLVQGIIMSEVLGPPRARKPYRNVITERNRNRNR
ncbi:hypothetical protein [Ornithinibacillus californiensis]|uniref:hypothetical protein n=1 Tax=Ornithinibacillus californiensis TaxID=161536 RepID=UPI00064D8AFE|nr:hypothetical protein [Ornithinibacillus californiensis]